MDSRRTVTQITRYGITGGGGLILNLALLIGFVDLFGFPESIAALLSTGLTLFMTFFVIERWVFTSYLSDDGRAAFKRAPIYYLVMISGKGVNFVIYLMLLSVNVWYPVAWGSGSIVVFGGTFLMNRFVWRRTADSATD